MFLKKLDECFQRKISLESFELIILHTSSKEVSNYLATKSENRFAFDLHYTSQETQKYLNTVPRRFEFVFTPTYGSWLNRVEGFLAKSQMLMDMGYRKQINQKMLQVGEPRPDCDEQFEIINDLEKQYLETGDPVIYVNIKEERKHW